MKPVQYTEPFLPPLEEYVEYLKGIWERNWLTNQGPLTRQLEEKLAAYHELAAPVHCVANGALGLQLVLKALGIGGEVITTPFSYVATASCPLWEGCSLRFADIEPTFLTLDPGAVIAAITPATEAILATHVFGNPAAVEAFEVIGRKYGLAIIYDAAHAFGVTCQGKSILSWGDASMVSLHATKLFHSVEGGFVAARDSAIAAKVEWMRRFGHNGQDGFHGVGINAKMSDFHAAMGLCNLDHIGRVIERRKAICDTYDGILGGLNGTINPVRTRTEATRNYGYYPVLFRDQSTLLRCISLLGRANVFPRRYFSPCLNTIFGSKNTGEYTVSEDVSKRILCLPLSASMDVSQARLIGDMLYETNSCSGSL